MADESNSISVPEAATVSLEAPVKKTRAPRAKKADAPTTEPAKKNRGGRPKRIEVTSAPAAASATTTRGKRASGATPVAGKRGPKRATKTTTAESPLADNFADLLQLEQENQRLRKSLSDKLRAENADLRIRLGLK